MARESSIDLLSAEDKTWLDKRFMDQGFCGYEEIANILQERGYNVSKSSVHRYGQKVEQKLAAVQASTQAAMMIADAAPDDSDMRSSAVLSLVQTELFNALIALQESENPDADPADRIMLMAKAGKGIAEISKASVNQKKWESENRERVKAAAKAVEKIVKKGGMSKDTVDEVKKEILGIIGL
ncbi:DUF3486 family protein [Acinetobacter pittii]|uniref:DUF3486 family protein n=1 Tax=Acinetobacter pittii TaxID=48296 RepID=UPI000839264E|nr:DUF3486 family protein [Acinetobacter pittii]MBJ8467645.1 DUF3486 family protein [Acinetobacter pittii]MBK1433785.1 DUF3486 family protein [Acinetobacter pittii]MBK1437565.1 DUF3486 family protein [Acinetobacter pittii]OCY86510.1 terminase [Acinetobacter pittii]